MRFPSIRELSSASLLLVASCAQDYGIAPKGPVNVHPSEVTECGFSPIAGTQMSRYDCNPVFSTTEETWAKEVHSVGFRAEIVLGHPMYQVWYIGSPTSAYGDYGLGYAVSSDGTNWDLYESNPVFEEDGGWDQDRMDAIKVVWDEKDNRYVMLYQGFTINGVWGLGLATSDDGIGWSPWSPEPVMDLRWPVGGVKYCWPLAFTQPATGGFSGLLAGGSGLFDQKCEVYGFSGQSLDTLQVNSGPILRAGPEYYDKAGMSSAAIVQYNGVYYMFYGGFEGWVPGDNPGVRMARDHSLNLATSADGINWVKHPDNPIPVHAENPGAITGVAAQVVNDRIHLWVTDHYEDLDVDAVGYFLYEPDAEPHSADAPDPEDPSDAG